MDASHNVVMLHMMRSMIDLLREGVFYNRKVMFQQYTSYEAILEQHEAINAALQARDPAAARAAVERHLDYVKQALMDHQRAERNADVARQRLEHEKANPDPDGRTLDDCAHATQPSAPSAGFSASR